MAGCRLPFRDWTLVGWRSLRFSMSRGRVHSARPVLVPPVAQLVHRLPPCVEWSGASWHRPCGAGNTTPAVLWCLGGGSSCAAASRRLARAAASRPVPRRRNVEPSRSEVPAHPRHGPRAPSGSEWLSAEYAVGVRGCARALRSWLGRRASSTDRASRLALSIRWATPLPCSSTSPCRPRSTRSDGTEVRVAGWLTAHPQCRPGWIGSDGRSRSRHRI